MAPEADPQDLDSLSDEAFGRHVASALFDLVLRRAPDPQALQAYGHAIATEALSPFGMTTELVRSAEFGPRASLHPPVAEHLVRCIFRALLGREPDPEAHAAFSAALVAGSGVDSLMAEVVGSPEFKSRHGGTEPRDAPAAPCTPMLNRPRVVKTEIDVEAQSLTTLDVLGRAVADATAAH